VRLLCIIAATLVLMGVPGVAASQSPTKTYRIGWLGDGTAPAAASQGSGDFQQGLRDVGYVEGRNVAIEYRSPPATSTAFPNSRPSWCARRSMSS